MNEQTANGPHGKIIWIYGTCPKKPFDIEEGRHNFDPATPENHSDEDVDVGGNSQPAGEQ